MGSFSIWHWLIVLLIVVMVFGTKKLKNIGGDIGGAVKGFKDGMKEGAPAPAADAAATATTTAQVSAPAPATTPPVVDQNTIDVQARQKKLIRFFIEPLEPPTASRFVRWSGLT